VEQMLCIWWQKLSNLHGRETCAFHFEVRIVF
jgi:hypothetical protein